MRVLFRKLTIYALTLVMLCSAPAVASASDCFTINVDRLDIGSGGYAQSRLTAQTQGISVVKYISDSSELAAQVRLTLMREDSHSLIFDKDYGYVSGVFNSGVIYLPYDDSFTVSYLVTLYVGDAMYAVPFMHQHAPVEQYDSYSEPDWDWEGSYEESGPSWESDPYEYIDPYEYDYGEDFGSGSDYEYFY